MGADHWQRRKRVCFFAGGFAAFHLGGGCSKSHLPHTPGREKESRPDLILEAIKSESFRNGRHHQAKESSPGGKANSEAAERASADGTPASMVGGQGATKQNFWNPNDSAKRSESP